MDLGQLYTKFQWEGRGRIGHPWIRQWVIHHGLFAKFIVKGIF